ncbi:uncharacterized protein TrAFT101_008911 [Trichoderma asperellum]|uniref:Uncharacterized protein n=1 Tax=Trichoderma asperellum (strain ATCC 204424 / CBS 433.97 / NBRC 101777) TaxID=1042311 RepID=A0A2T3ZAZ8_TRIA4|nr:hypothetical protein M441DRAFT_136374 [Trichoderma asperellum CBS 433.97]PTB41988.1 hypothetical protein M441DRAFT_136374 [Trichoderma asperellum CBS 433.97]UKZ94016.1 hypothetical protein TrAFT101_008911 [Trichoderma asperellum]
MASPGPEPAPEVTTPNNNRAPHQKKKDRDLSDPDDASTSDAAFKKAAAESQRRSELILSYARLPNGQEIELPLDDDFIGFHALPRKGYYMRLLQLREQVNSQDKRALPESFKAPPPWVPDPTDDDARAHAHWGEDEENEENDCNSHGSRSAYNSRRPRKRVCRRPNRTPRAQRYHKKFYHLSKEFVLPEDESEEEELPEHIIRKTPPTFMGIPREIRMKIYHHLLVNKKPITVHGEWKQVRRSNSLRLSTGILSVCKIVHEEACVVLYGENVFLYLLRDPIYSQQAILSLATHDGDISAEDEGESGSEYEDEEESLFCNDHREKCIDIAKYAHLFRKIVVEAEHNRYSKATRESMAAAIKVFAKSSDGAPRDDTCNIRTLTIRVSPLWHEEEDEPGTGRFTFIDFFEAQAPVIKAIKTVDCQILHVEILTRYMSRLSSNSAITLSEDGSVRFTVDRRWERYHNMIRQGRAHQGVLDERDKVMQYRMSQMTNRTSTAIDELAKHVEAQCNERNFHQDTTMGLAINWPNLDFDDVDDVTY